MRKQTKAALAIARVEKDVENAYRGEITHLRPMAEITSPHGTDGYARWEALQEGADKPTSVRLLLEAKFDVDFKKKGHACGVIGQLLLYLKRFEAAGSVMPNVLFAGDKSRCFVFSTASVVDFLNLPIDWTAAPSTGSPELTRELVEKYVLPHVFDADEPLDFREVLAKVEALAAGAQHATRATTTNVDGMFFYWHRHVLTDTALTPVEKVDVFLRCLFKPKDVKLDDSKRGFLNVPGYPKGVRVHAEHYRSFFNNFKQGYNPSEIEAFYAMKDQLVDDDARRRQGAFFTPRLWVDEAHKELDRVLGKKWREECLVWDPAAGTANLTRGYSFADLIISTAERPDVQVVKDQGYNTGASIFQYDFLNPGVESPFFEADVRSLIPPSVERKLRAAAEAGKRLVFLMNPPYAEDGDAGLILDRKQGVALTNTNKDMGKLGRANRQLYAQFMYRCSVVAREYGFKDSTTALFSMSKFMCSGSFRPFRDWWYNRHAYAGGFFFQASHFADVSGAWGISFTVWNSGAKTDNVATLPITLKDEQDFSVVSIGTKGFYNSDGQAASEWVETQTSNAGDTPKFTSGLKVVERWDGGCTSGSLGVMVSQANNLQQSAALTYFISGKSAHKGSRQFDLLPDNWRRAVALYGARKLVQDQWSIHEDEYLRPDEKKDGYEQWVDDCHVYALLDTKNNCTAMRNVTYKGKSWRIKNHWFWRTQKEALEALETPDTGGISRDCKNEPVKPRPVVPQEDPDDPFGFGTVSPEPERAWEYTGDAYFAHLLTYEGLRERLSPDTRRVLDLLDALWVKSLPVREDYAAGKPELHLTAYDAGVYQLKHLWRDRFPTEWAEMQASFKALSERLREGVYEYGFLRR